MKIGMAITPTFSIQYCRIIAGLVVEFQQRTGMSDTQMAKATGMSRDTVSVIRNFNGANAAPNLNSMIRVEAFIRDHFDPDDQKSEQIYRDCIARGVRAAGYTGGKFSLPD